MGSAGQLYWLDSRREKRNLKCIKVDPMYRGASVLPNRVFPSCKKSKTATDQKHTHSYKIASWRQTAFFTLMSGFTDLIVYSPGQEKGEKTSGPQNCDRVFLQDQKRKKACFSGDSKTFPKWSGEPQRSSLFSCQTQSDVSQTHKPNRYAQV